MARWFRSHTAKLDNPKVQRLADALYGAWDSLLCLADVAACRTDAGPIALTAKQRKLAEQRVISLQRRCERGAAQISAIAARWRVAMSLEEWGQGQ